MPATADIDLFTIPTAQRTAVSALVEKVAALTEIIQRQEHLIAELNHALHGKRSKKLTEDERQLAFEDLPIALAEVEVQKGHLAAQLRVIVSVRPKYASRTCTDGVTQAPAPTHLITGGLPTEATLVHVLVSKYADHHRQSQILARTGLDLHRAVLADWGGKAAFHLKPVVDRLAEPSRKGGDPIRVAHCWARAPQAEGSL
ncbi:IS66 family transposase [Celeribacter sp.]|uniref:IS66 family transposase n=1 Tax=Celeribacter sp. TaxID=1890673 RepID=UPI003A94A29C